MDQQLNFAGTNLVSLAVYIMMALIYVIGLKSCVFPLFSVRKALRNAVGRLDKRSEQGAYLYDNPRFLNCRYIDDWWGRYVFNLREMRRTNGDCDVIHFINSNTVILAPSHNQFAELIPGMMTSLGVLGTFIGLVRGLSGLQVQTSDVAVLQASIAQLITGMNSAFYTSIAGVICAVSFQLIRRMAISAATDSLNRFVQACQVIVSKPYTQDTKLIQTIHALLIEVRKSNEAVQQVLRDNRRGA